MNGNEKSKKGRSERAAFIHRSAKPAASRAGQPRIAQHARLGPPKPGLVNAHGEKLRQGIDLVIGMPLLSPLNADAEVLESIGLLRDYTIYAGFMVYPINAMHYGSDISDNRNEIVYSAQSKKAKYVLMIDGDTSHIPPFAAVKLMESATPDRQVISGTYMGRQIPHFPIAGHIDAETGMCDAMADFEPGKGLVKVDWAGGGLLLIDLEVFEKLRAAKYEIFPGTTVDGNQLPFFHKQLHFHRLRKRYEEEGEDTTFCRKCAQAGVSIWLDTDLLVGHRIHYDVIPKDHLRFKPEIAKFIEEGAKPVEMWQRALPE